MTGPIRIWGEPRPAWKVQPQLAEPPISTMVVAAANSLDHILSEEEHTHAANGRQIYSLFDDEQDWAGLLNGLEPVSQRILAMPHPNAPLSTLVLRRSRINPPRRHRGPRRSVDRSRSLKLGGHSRSRHRQRAC